jgi:Fe2+ or Zn2+ uptake regulation protein
MSVFRRLKALGYRSSYNHAGRYYTLSDVPQFDNWGLWFHRDIGFSCVGTLKATVLELVQNSATGMTPKELLALLRLPVANTLYNTLHELRGNGRIARQELAGYHLYLSADPQQADKQLTERQDAIDREPRSRRQLADDLVIAVLVEALHSAQPLVSASAVASRLQARGVLVTPAQVEQVFSQFGLESGKKTVD